MPGLEFTLVVEEPNCVTVRGVNAGNVQALVDSMKPHYPMAICRVFGQSGESRASAASQRAAIEILDEALSGSSDPAVQQRLRDRIAAIGEGCQASPTSQEAAIKILTEALSSCRDADERQRLTDRIAAIGEESHASSDSRKAAINVLGDLLRGTFDPAERLRLAQRIDVIRKKSCASQFQGRALTAVAPTVKWFPPQGPACPLSFRCLAQPALCWRTLPSVASRDQTVQHPAFGNR